MDSYDKTGSYRTTPQFRSQTSENNPNSIQLDSIRILKK